MKNLPSNLKNFEKELKRFLKKKISIDDGIVVKYLIAGFIGLFVVNTSVFATVLNKEDGELKSDAYLIQIGKNASVPAVNNGIYSAGAIAIGEEAKVTSSESIAIGYKAQNNKAHNVAIGSYAKTEEQQATAIGEEAFAKSIGSTALGYRANSTGQKAIAIGSEAAASAVDSLAAGTKAAASGIYSLALGTDAAASGPYSIAFGKDTKAEKHGTVALGFTSKATEHHSTALGEAAAVTAENATALGYKSSASGKDSLALGHNANASVEGGVALGSESVASTQANIQGYKPGNNYNGLTGTALTANKAAVSVGNGSTITRQITGLAAGTSDTDAVNVAQLKSLQKSIKLNTSGNSGTGSVLLDDQTLAVTGTNGITTAANGQGIAIKLDDATKAKIDSAMSSFNIKANSENTSQAISNGDTITFKEGDNIKVTRNGKDITIATSKTPTFDSVIITNGPVLNSNGINMNNKKITNVANGTNPNDAVNLSQLNAATETYFHVNTGNNTGGNSTTNLGAIDKSAGAQSRGAITAGVNAKVKGAQGIAIGNNTTVRTTDVDRRGSVAIGSEAIISGTTSGQNSLSSVAIGANAIAGRLFDDNNRLSNTDSRYAVKTGGLNATNTNDELNIMYLAGLKNDLENRNSTNDATAIGAESRAIGDQSIAIGAQVIAGDASVAIGGNDMYSVLTDANRQIFKDTTGTALANNTSQGDQRGYYPTTSAMKGSVAIGQKAYSRTLMGTAIGLSAFVNEDAELGTAIGAGSRVGQKNGGVSTKGGTAIAAGAVAEGDYTTAIGTGTQSLATEATAVGYRNKIENTGKRSVTVGSNITVTTADSVVLGSGSDGSAAATKETTGTITASTGDTLTYGTFVGAPPTKDGNLSTGHYVSVGSKDAERQIKHVAAGKVSSDSTDAINGSQLYATNLTLGNVAGSVKKILGGNAALAADGNLTMTNIGDTGKNTVHEAIQAARTEVKSSDSSVSVNKSTDATTGNYIYDLKVTSTGGTAPNTYFHVNDGTTTQAAGSNPTENLGAIDSKAGATGKYAVTVGVKTQATAENSIAMGTSANSSAKEAVAIGLNSISSGESAVAIGVGSNASGSTTVALGRVAKATGEASIALGNNAQAIKGNDLAFGGDAKAMGGVSTAIGNGALSMGSNSSSLGAYAISHGRTSTAIGQDATSYAADSLAAGTGSSSAGTSSVAIGQKSRSDSNNSLALGTGAKVISTNATITMKDGTNISPAEENSQNFRKEVQRISSHNNSENSLALGNSAVITDSKNAVAIGASAEITKGANSAVALGKGAQATVADGVALGSNSKATINKNVTGYKPDGRTNNYSGLTGNVLKSTHAAVSVGDGATITRQITGVAAGTQDTDAVNVAQLRSVNLKIAGNSGTGDVLLDNQTLTVNGENGITTVADNNTVTVKLDDKTKNNIDKIDKGFKITADNKGLDADGNPITEDTVKLGETVTYTSENKSVVTTVKDNKIDFKVSDDLTLGAKNGADGKDGVDGKLGINGKDGSSVVINGKDGSIGLNGKDGSNGLTIKGDKGADGLDGTNGEDGKTRIVYETKDKNGNSIREEVATLNDGLKFAGDDGSDASKVISKKLNQQLDIVGGADKNNLTDNNIGVNNVDGKLKVQLAKDVNLTEDGSLTIGDTKVNKDGLAITNGPSVTKDGINAGDKQITNVASGLGNTKLSDAAGDTLKNAVNVGDLKNSITESETALTNKGLKFGANSGETVTNKLGSEVEIVGSGAKTDDKYSSKNIKTKVSQDAATGKTTVEVMLDKELNVDKVTVGEKGADGKDGVDGTIGVNGKDGSAVVINGKDGSIGLNGKDGSNGLTIKGDKGADGLDGTNGTDGKTRIVYETVNPDGSKTKEEVATLNDGLKFAGDDGSDASKVIAKKLNQQLEIVGGANKDNLTDKNIGVNNVDGKLKVQLAKDLTDITSISNGDTKITLGKDTAGNKTVNIGGSQLTEVKSGASGTDADGNPVYGNDTNGANIGDVKNIANNAKDELTNKGLKFGANSGETVTNKLGSEVEIVGSGVKEDTEYSSKNIKTKVSQDATTGKTTVEVMLDKELNVDKVTVGEKGADGKDGVDGTIGVNGKDGSAVVINGKDGSIGLNGKDGSNGLTIKGDAGPAGVNGTDGETVTRIVYERTNPDGTKTKEEVATLNDGLKFTGNNETTLNKHKLNTTVKVVGERTDTKTSYTTAESAANNIIVEADGTDKLTIKLAKDLTNLNSISNGKTGDSETKITLGDKKVDVGGSKITNVAPGTEGTDAVNLDQLNKSITDNKTQLVDGKNTTVSGKGTADDPYKVNVSDNLTLGAKDGADGKDGVDGTIGVNGKDGSAVVINGKDGSIGLNGKDGSNGLTIKGDKGADGLDGTNGADGKTRIVYETVNPDGTKNKEEVATLNDGLKFAGDDGSDASKVISKKLNQQLDIVGGADKDKLTDKNIGVNNVDGKLKVQLAKDVNLTEDGSLTIGDTKVNKDGLAITNGPSVTKDGIKAGDKQITNVASGLGNTALETAAGDTLKNAVNVGDLKNATTNLVDKGFKITADQKDLGLDADGNPIIEDTVKLGETVTYTSENGTVVTTVKDNKIDFKVSDNLTLGKAGQDGVDGKIGVNGKDGSSVVIDGKDGSIDANGSNGAGVAINGKDGSIGLTGPKGDDGTPGKTVTIKGKDGAVGLDGQDGVSRIVYTDPNGKENELATMNDGLKFTGNNSDTLNKHKLNSIVNVVGERTDNTKTYTAAESAANNIIVEADGTDKLTVKLAKDLTNLNSISNGKTGDSETKITLGDKSVSFGGSQLTEVKSGSSGTDADGNPEYNTDTNGANIGDVKNIANNAKNELTNKGLNFAANSGENVHKNLGETLTIKGTGEKADEEYSSKNIKTKTNADGSLEIMLAKDLEANKVTVGKDGKDGVDGEIGVNGKDGSSVVLNGKDGSIGLTGPKGADGKDGASANISVKDGRPGVDGKDGETKTRIVYEPKNPDGTPKVDENGNPITEEVATLNDGLKFKGDDGTEVVKKLNETLDVVGGANKDNLTDNNIGVNNVNGKLKVQLAKDLTDITSISNGDTKITLGKDDAGNKTVNIGGSQLTDVASGLGNSTLETAAGDTLKNAVNVGDLKNATTNLVDKGFKITADNKALADNATEDTVKLGETVSYTSENGTVVTTVKDNKIDFKVSKDLTLGKDGENGEDGSLTVNGKDGSVVAIDGKDNTITAAGKDGNGVIIDGKDGSITAIGKDGTGVVINGKDGSIGLTGPKGADGKDGASANISVKDGRPGVDGKDGETKTRIVYETKDANGNPITEEVATLNDGLKFKGDDGTEVVKKLNDTLDVVGGANKDNLTDKNIGVNNVDGKLKVQLAKDLTDITSISNGDTKITLGKDAAGNKTVNIGGSQLTEVASGASGKDAAGKPVYENDTNGANIGDVKNIANNAKDELTNKGLKFGANSGETVTNKLGSEVEIVGSGTKTDDKYSSKNIKTKVSQDATTGKTTVEVMLDKELNVDKVTVGEKGADGKDGVDGEIGVNGKDGASVVLNGKDGSIGLTGPKGADGKDGASANISVKDGRPGVDGKDGETKTRIVYEPKNPDGTSKVDENGNPITEEVATLNDGLKFKGDDGTEVVKKLNETLDVVGGANKDNLTDKNIGVNNVDGKLKVQLAKDLTDITSISNGETKITLGKDDAGNKTVNIGGSQLTDVASGASGKDADGNPEYKTDTNGANIGDVKNIVENSETTLTNKGLKFGANSGETVTNKLGSEVEIVGSGTKTDDKYSSENIKTKVSQDATGKTTVEVMLDKDLKANSIEVGEKGADGKDGVDGTIGVNGKDGASVVIDGKDGSIGLTGPRGTDGKDGASANISVKDGQPGVDGKDGETKTRIVYEPKNPDGTPKVDENGDPIKEEVATLNDGLNFMGDTGANAAVKLNKKVDIVGGQTDKTKLSEGSNIGVVSSQEGENGKLKIQLAKDLTDITSISNGDTKITLGKDDAGNKTVDIGGSKITNVAPGTEGTDAVNLDQLNKSIADNKTQLVDGKNTTVSGSGTKDDPYKVNLNDTVILGTGENQVKLDGTNGTVKVGDTTINSDGLTIVGGPSVTKDGINAGNKQITDLASGATGTDANNKPIYGNDTNAANIGDVKAIAGDVINNAKDELVSKGLTFTDDNGVEVHRDLGTKLQVAGDGNITTTADPTNGKITVGLGNDINVGAKDGVDGKPGKDGSIGVNGKDGSSVVLNGKDGSIGLTGPKGADGKDGASANISVKDGQPGVDGKDGETKTRIVYEPKNPDGTPKVDENGNPITEEVATLNDGLNFMGDTGENAAVKLNKKVDIVGGQTDKTKLSEGANIGVVSSQNGPNGKLEIKLAKDLTGISSITLVGGKDKDGNDQKVTINVSKDGALDLGNKQITGVADGKISKDSTDAINGSQLYETKQEIGNVINQHANAINNNSKRISKLEGRVDSGLANSAAMATLEFQEIGINQAVVGAAIGTYRGNQAVAVGVMGAPTENVRVQAKVSVAPGTRDGGLDTMAGVGASWRFNLK